MKKLLLFAITFTFVGSVCNFGFSQNFSIKFDGDDDYVEVVNSSTFFNFGTGDFTLEHWFKTNGPLTVHLTGSILKLGSTNPPINHYYDISPRLNDFDNLVFHFANGDGQDYYAVSTVDVDDENWHHICGVRESNAIYIYIDGVLTGQGTLPSNASADNTGPLKFRPWGYSNPVVNYMDEVRIWDRALSASEVLDNSTTCSLTGTETGLIGYWNFNEGTGIITYDQTSNGNNGTLINGPTWSSDDTPCYSISTSANPTNGGSTTGEGDYITGTQVTVVGIPNTGWIFQNWTENGNVVSTDSSYTFTVSNDRDLAANFDSIIYTIITISNPTNGGSTSGGGDYSYGTIITLTASPNSGWYFINWTENGNVVSTSPSFQYTVTGNSTLVANFNQQEPYTITTSSNPVQGGITSGGGNYLPGSQCTVIATPNFGYLFYNWTEYGNQVSTTPIYTFTVTENRTLVANFYLEVGIDEIKPTFNIFPNPSSGIVHIRSNKPIEKLLVYNSIGVVVKNIEFNQPDLTIDLSLYPKGVYFVKIIIDNKVFSNKVFLLY